MTDENPKRWVRWGKVSLASAALGYCVLQSANALGSFHKSQCLKRIIMFTYVFVMPGILQSQLIEKGFKKTKNFEYKLVLLLFLYIYFFF